MQRKTFIKYEKGTYMTETEYIGGIIDLIQNDPQKKSDFTNFEMENEECPECGIELYNGHCTYCNQRGQ